MRHPKSRLPDYALGELTPGQRAEVEAHLQRCPRCRAEVRQLEQVFVDWIDALPEVAPPDRVKTALFAQLGRDRVSGVTVDAAADAAADTAADTAAAEPLPEIVHDRAPARWLAAACAACLALAGIGFYRDSQTQLAYAQLRAEQVLVARFLAQPGGQTATLYGPNGQGLGAALLGAQDEALLVLAEPPPERRVYQAWGHVSDDWNPRSGAQLTSLGTSEGGVFEVSTAGFAALYLSLEPVGGSPQPTQPLSKVSLSAPAASAAIEVTTPSDGAVLGSDTVVVRGRLDDTVRALQYSLNGGEPVAAAFADNRFIFTLTDLEPGQNRLELSATDAAGTTRSKSLTLTYLSE